MSEKPKEFYSIKELAVYLNISQRTLLRIIERGELPYYVIGRVRRFRHADIEAYLTRRRQVGVRKDKDDDDEG